MASLAEQNVFLDIKPFFSFPLWCKKACQGADHFSGLPSPSDGKNICFCCQWVWEEGKTLILEEVGAVAGG